MNLKKILLHWLPVILYSSFIFYLSSRSDVHVQHDKMTHTSAYGLLALLFLWALRLHVKSFPRLLVYAVILTTLYGMTDEYHQSFVPGRDSDIHDVFADFFGALMGVSVYVFIASFSKNKSRA